MHSSERYAHHGDARWCSIQQKTTWWFVHVGLQLSYRFHCKTEGGVCCWRVLDFGGILCKTTWWLAGVVSIVESFSFALKESFAGFWGIFTGLATGHIPVENPGPTIVWSLPLLQFVSICLHRTTHLRDSLLIQAGGFLLFSWGGLWEKWTCSMPPKHGHSVLPMDLYNVVHKSVKVAGLATIRTFASN